MDDRKLNISHLHLLLTTGLCTTALLGVIPDANALPLFGRQTGQNCLSCHAGGHFPDLTPYGRMFKLTGYTMGERTIPLAAMAVGSLNNTRNVSNTSDPNGDPNADFPNNGKPILATGSLFTGGKITDNLGAFVQFTFDNYQGSDPNSAFWKGHADNVDVRLVDRFIRTDRDLIVGLTVNNNPTVQDVWNSVPAWGYGVVPGSTGLGGTAPSPLVSGGLGQQVAGLGGYAYLNRQLYLEASLYKTAEGALSPLSYNVTGSSLRGAAPYGRVALNHEWGAHNAMLGAFFLDANTYDPTASTDTTHYRDVGFDTQYQYLLDPHSVTVNASYIHERINHPASVANQAGAYDAAAGTALQSPTNTDDTLDLFRAKATYVYGAKYGGSLSFFNLNGTTNSANQTALLDPAIPGMGGTATNGAPAVSDNASGNPATRGWTGEAFWMPTQNARLGLQYTVFDRYNGAANNYNGAGRNANDNNTLFLYLWAAY